MGLILVITDIGQFENAHKRCQILNTRIQPLAVFCKTLASNFIIPVGIYVCPDCYRSLHVTLAQENFLCQKYIWCFQLE